MSQLNAAQDLPRIQQCATFHSHVIHDPLNFFRICRIVRDFERQSSEMDMKGEMMVSAGFEVPETEFSFEELKSHVKWYFLLLLKLRVQGEAVDGALEGEDDEQRIDDQVALVIAELGIGLKQDDVRTSPIDNHPPLPPHKRIRHSHCIAAAHTTTHFRPPEKPAESAPWRKCVGGVRPRKAPRRAQEGRLVEAK
jgi:hypothetical protein